MNKERQEEISFIVTIIDKLCKEYKVALIPKETEKGTKYVGIYDNITGKTYAMIKE